MAIINYYTRQPNDSRFHLERINHDGTTVDWLLNNISKGENFHVYKGDINEAEDISRDFDAILESIEISVFHLPAGDPLTVALVVSLVVSVGISLLTPKPKALQNVNRQQESPNNSLAVRENQARPNQRIVDVCGIVKSIPDTLQQEFAKYVDGIEERIGYYCIARNQVKVEDIKESDTLIADIEGQSAGVYYPFNSPNNASPDIQIGDPINEPVWGVTQSSDAIGQTLDAPNNTGTDIGYGLIIRNVDDLTGYIEDQFGNSNYTSIFDNNDQVSLSGIFTEIGGPEIGLATNRIQSVTDNRINFDISSDPSWGTFTSSFVVDNGGDQPSVTKIKEVVIGPFKISSVKIDRLIVNTVALSGMYREDGGGRSSASVQYKVIYQKLNDLLQPVGPATPVFQTITGDNAREKGASIDIDLGGLTYIEYSVIRVTNKDFKFNGNISDEIKLKDVFGMFSVDKTNFGNVTTIQTKRRQLAQATAIKSPEINCIATEMINEYQGSGVFNPTLTPNDRGMQSLIRLALDPKIGRRQQGELDLDLLLSVQGEVDTYFNDLQGGSFNYSFDSTDTTAQETIYTICNAMFCIPWREGRVLKALFEKPQIVPSMVFTHRSKKPNTETWTTTFPSKKRKDSIEFKYIDDQLYTQETLYFPANQSGINPLKIEIPGIKGITQATWRMMREYNKLIHQNVNVDFTSTQEGRLVKPQEMISVVKGSRVLSSDGYIRNKTGLLLELSQDVTFTSGDDHFILLKKRNGTVESIPVFDVGQKRTVLLGFNPAEDVYTGNDAAKTEFSFGNEARLDGQLILPQAIEPSNQQYVKIKGINYSDLYYKDDPIQVIKGGFDSGFDPGFF